VKPRYDVERIRGRLVTIRVEAFYRMIRVLHEDDPLGVAPKPSRFSDPAGGFAVLYAAATVRCAFWESIARNRFTRRKNRELPTSTVNAMRVVTLRSTKPLVLLDLRGDGPIRIGAPTAVAHDTNHAAGRALSAAIYAIVPEADGLVFPSRFTGHTCIAVFGHAVIAVPLTREWRPNDAMTYRQLRNRGGDAAPTIVS